MPAGHASEFETIIDTHWATVLGLAFRMTGDRNEAESIRVRSPIVTRPGGIVPPRTGRWADRLTSINMMDRRRHRPGRAEWRQHSGRVARSGR